VHLRGAEATFSPLSAAFASAKSRPLADGSIYSLVEWSLRTRRAQSEGSTRRLRASATDCGVQANGFHRRLGNTRNLP